MSNSTKAYYPQSFFSEKYRVIHHVLFWSLYLSYALFIHFFTIGFGGLQWLPFIMLIDGITIYFNIEFLTPKYLIHRKLVPYFFLTSVSLLFNIGVNFGLQHFVFNEFYCNTIYSCLRQQSYSIIFSLVFLVIAIGLKLLKLNFQSLEKIKNLKETNINTELDYLKTQVNPHFLFNTLNNIKVLITINQQKATETLIKLSGLLRYQLYDCSEEKVLLTSELKYLQNYLDLQRIRVNNARIDFNSEGNFQGVLIYPFIFIPFIENAVKHGLEGSNEEAILKVNIKLLNKTLIFIVENTKNNAKTENGGIGLVNVKRRLDILFPQNHNLEIADSDDIYKVKLTINLEQ